MFQDASQSFDPRSIEDPRLQPWRQWWPYRPHNGDKTNNPVLVDTAGKAPWINWEFNNERPWEKPWIDWPLRWSPKYYGHSHVEPEVYHDPDFIAECVQQQMHHPISVFDPPRTTSFVQFFSEKLGHAGEKPYALRVPVSGASQLQSNFEGAWSQIMLTDARGHEDMFSLDEDGFAWLNHTCQTNVLDQSFDVHSYMREMSDFLCQHFNAQEIFIYDYVRRSPDPADRMIGFSDITRRIHCGKFFLALKLNFIAIYF
ncbi:uncharacterized protein TRUGW13939_07663 [Talaromyces rugulosus]|uniref:Uncharacterized protein n=1 Tax=Talaromyces rugulosus TaxID=121627 RepID=A0A7H8R3B3_TALRU|nr:uncharacterized protein TRUGW13939_07663 [Talaromyces rugulosus]QKX60518.1 hypothetical protein TRUGW13939_07663 [Talaromyces rugulosus]